MFKIYIDTSKRREKLVQLVKETPGSREILSEKTGDLDVIFEIKNILREHGIRIADIDEFYAFPGPGSFTGLKMGITDVNVLNFVLGKKAVDELQVPEYGSEPNIQKPRQ